MESHPSHLPFFTWVTDKGADAFTATFGDFMSSVKLCARALAYHPDLALKKGDAACLIFEPSYNFYITIIACFYLGVIVVPVYPPFPATKASEMEKVRRVLADFLPGLPKDRKLVILCSKLVATSVKAAKVLKLLSKDDIWSWVRSTKFQDVESIAFGKKAAAKYFDRIMPSQPTDADIAFIQYTSGSTGTPKGVVNHYRHLLANFAQMSTVINFKSLNDNSRREIFVSWLPQYHDYGLIAPNFGYALVLKAAKNCKTSVALDLSSLNVLECAAEPINYENIREFLDYFQRYKLDPLVFSPAYGLAEHVLGVSTAPYPFHLKTVDQRVPCGQVFHGINVKIVDTERFEEMNEGEVGEIWIDSVAKPAGYWNNLALTQEIFQARLSNGSNQVYLRTGDLGFMLNGELVVAGRLKDMIIIQGRNFFANDIELAALASQSDKLRCGSIAAFSIDPLTLGLDAKLPEQLIVVVEVKVALVKAPKTKLQNICDSIYGDIISTLGIHSYCIVLVKPRTVPRTTSGKIRRKSTKELFVSKKLSIIYEKKYEAEMDVELNTAAIMENVEADVDLTPQEFIAAVWSEVLSIPVENITSDSTFFELGGSSLSGVQAVRKINKQPELAAITFSTLSTHSLADLVAYCLQHESFIPLPSVTISNRMDQFIRPASGSEERLLIHNQLQPNSRQYVEQMSVTLSDASEKELCKAVTQLVSRHEALRTIYSWNQSIAQATVFAANTAVCIHSVKSIQEVETISSKPFDLTKETSCRFAILTSSEICALYLIAHHICYDGSCVPIFERELRSLCSGVALSPPVSQYSDFVNWEKSLEESGVFEAQQKYWKLKLENSILLPFSHQGGDHVLFSLSTNFGAQNGPSTRKRGS
ncbi:acetyl-CoA synthetase-like protein [Rhizoclosmatium globosum]|uniref:Acetyl-CoA synthetase-like protein n=1 Tax=Rhizoclosmatium globosum TaxID=329046 RepID=A0A1Y2BS87_9FUNG|nr:acetyl-CoA synthetase-like protein [Rhizoclosmatium globosum]|eukprot:ORY37622.1 acetyl-CoA synthetase-like protein [Rhizoclosmatium globosum]